jgi:hypothetical protein
MVHAGTMGIVAKNSAQIAPDATEISVTSTSGWPVAGRVVLYYQGIYRTIRYTTKTETTITLEERWAFDTIPANGANLQAVTPNWALVRRLAVRNTRARHILVMIDAMTDFSRAKLNRLSAYSDMGESDVLGNQVEGIRSGDFVGYLLKDKFGLATAKYSARTDDVILPSISTQKATYMQVIRDLAKRTGMHLFCQAGNALRWRPCPEHPLGGMSSEEEDDVDWSFTAGDMVNITGEFSERNRVSQVRLKVQIGTARQTMTVCYPEDLASSTWLDRCGIVYQPEETVFVSDENTARYVAEMLYNRLAYPLTVTMTLPVPVKDWLHPLQRVSVNWPTDISVASTESDLTGTFKIVSVTQRSTGLGAKRQHFSVVTLQRLHT